MSIRLYQLLFENKEQSALDYLSKILKNSPYEGKVFLAGGAVRDEILGKPVKDIDVVVSMPDGGIEFANWITQKTGAFKHGANPVIFPRFGTAKFNLRGINHNGIDLGDVDIESVMTRGEKYEKGSRKPEVVYADLEDDAYRRDLTVNSLFKDLSTGEIKDFTGRGIADIKAGIVRTPMDADITFRDDPLRMLRAIRFAVKYNWKMPLSMVKALKRNADMLLNISNERIRDELDKMLMTNSPDKAMKLLSYTGLNRHILPELDACHGVTQNVYHDEDVFNHIMTVLKNTEPDITARLASLFHDIGKPETRSEDVNPKTGKPEVHFYEHEDVGARIAENAMRRLKYSGEETAKVTKIVQMHMRLKSAGPDGNGVSDKAIRKFMADAGDVLDPALKTMQADNISHSKIGAMPNQIEFLKHRMQNLQSTTSLQSKPALPINGNDIMKQFNIKPGPAIKHLLAAVEDAWYNDPNITRDDALQVVKGALDREQTGDQGSDVLDQKIRNPETGNDILVKTALKYPQDHPAYKSAASLVKRSQK